MEGPQVKHRPPGEDYWQNIDGTLSCRSTIIAALKPSGGEVEERTFDRQGRLIGVVLNDGTVLRWSPVTTSLNSKDHSRPSSQDTASAKAGKSKGKTFGETIVTSKSIFIRNFIVCLIKGLLHINPIHPKYRKDMKIKCFFEDFDILKDHFLKK